MANTGDIDIAQFEKLSVALQDQVDPGLAETFAALKFTPLPDLDPAKTWRWEHGGSGQLVEFLTPRSVMKPSATCPLWESTRKP